MSTPACALRLRVRSSRSVSRASARGRRVLPRVARRPNARDRRGRGHHLFLIEVAATHRRLITPSLRSLLADVTAATEERSRTAGVFIAEFRPLFEARPQNGQPTLRGLVKTPTRELLVSDPPATATGRTLDDRKRSCERQYPHVASPTQSRSQTEGATSPAAVG